ncbi:MAG: phosphoesterase [Rhodocyclaceae bacterium]|nr:phosphoesterase [Rhodocyclaceae bacterium]
MKLHILSDTHLELSGFQPPTTDADIVVLAGDIGIGLQGIDWAERSFDVPVVYVFGNHEYYGHDIDRLIDQARKRCEGSNVHFLENSTQVLDGVRFIGCTLWTDFALRGCDEVERNMAYASLNMTDFQQIKLLQPGIPPGARLSPRLTLARHCASRDFLERTLEPSAGSGNWSQTVVVTHHAPSAMSLRGGKSWDILDAAYASHLDSLVGRADLWIHGHTHVVADYQVPEIGRFPQAGRRVVSNPRGYSDQGADAVVGFDPQRVARI